MPDPYIQGMNTLSTYLSENDLTQEAFAAAISVRQATVSRLVSGKQKPSWSLAQRIEQATGGAVPMLAWAPGETA